MFSLRLLYYVWAGTAATIAASSSSHNIDKLQSAGAKFIDDLDLLAAQAQSVLRTLEADSNLASFLNGTDFLESGLVSLACNVAQTIFGAESVDTAPVEQTDVMLNWYIVA